jgi:putative isomerase
VSAGDRALVAIGERIDLAAVPFTERGSRLLVVRDERGGLRVACAEYERNAADPSPLKSLRFLDGADAPLSMDLAAMPDRLELRAPGGAGLLAFDGPETLIVRLPTAPAVAELTVRGARASLRDGALVVDANRGDHGLAVTASPAWTRGEMEPAGAGRWRVRLAFDAGTPPVLALRIAPGPPNPPAVADPAACAASARARWLAWLGRAPAVRDDLADAAAFAWWILGVNLLRMRHDPRWEAVVPSKVGYVGTWQWDAYFHALALRHVDPALARDQLRIMLAHQLPDGMIPDVVHDEGVLARSTEMPPADRARSLVHAGRDVLATAAPAFLDAPLTKPPLTAWAAWRIHEIDPDLAFLAEVHGAAARSQAWWFGASDPEATGLPRYLHPYSSGIDDSPLWDGGLPIETPDLPAYLALQADHLARMADALGRPVEAATWRSEARVTVERLMARWDPSHGAFRAIRHGRPVEVDTPFGLMPIVTGRLAPAVVDGIVASLEDPARFWTHAPVATVSAADPRYSSGAMWRGPAWLFVNYLLIDGLARSGRPEVAGRLRERTLAMVAAGHGMAEYYDSQSGGSGIRAVSTFSGTAALFLDLAIGLSLDTGIARAPN